MINPQTTLICSMLDLIDPNAVFLGKDSTYNLPDDENSPEGASDDEDDEVEEGYESEQSFISLSGSERSFSDRSFSLISQNDSITSAENIDISEADNIDSVNKEELTERLEDGVRINENVMNAEEQNKVVMSSTKLTPRKSASTEELSALIAAQQKEKLKLTLSLSSASAESDDKEKAKVSSLSDSSLECKFLDISDDDPELQEMLVAQRRHSTSKAEDQKSTSNKMVEASWEDEDLEFQEIISMQKKNQETIPDLQKDFDMKPVYQSSPAVSMDDRVEQNMSSDDLSPQSRQKRERLRMKTFESPMMKKFKRRNSELYFESSKDEDNIDS